MRAVFMGTPEFALPSLQAIDDVCELTLVVTRPDAVRGRGKQLVASPVKEQARALGVPVLEANRIGEAELARIASEKPDIIVVVAYGCILPDELLALPSLECMNVHASLLPRWRGAAPIQRAILAQDEHIGVSIMRVVPELDAGPTCVQASLPAKEMNSAQATRALSILGARSLLKALALIDDGSVRWTEQDEHDVTYAHKIEKRELLLDPACSAQENVLRVRASSDAAPARALLAGKGVRVLEARVCPVRAQEGELAFAEGAPLLGCADGVLELLRVKPDGKGELDACAWARGVHGSSLSWEHI